MLNLDRMEAWEEYVVPVMLLDRIFFSQNGIVIKILIGLSLMVLAVLCRERF